MRHLAYWFDWFVLFVMHPIMDMMDPFSTDEDYDREVEDFSERYGD